MPLLTLLLAALLRQDAVPADKDREAAARTLRADVAESSLERKTAALQEALKTEQHTVIKLVGKRMEAVILLVAAATARGAADPPAAAEALGAALAAHRRREEDLPARGSRRSESSAGRVPPGA